MIRTTIATKADFRVETMRGRGPGGQKRNKTDSAVRITHIPTGMSEYCCATPSQHRNKRTAFLRLADRVVAWHLRAEAKARYGAGHERIRTYHEPDDRVTDHRTGSTFSFKRIVGRRDLRPILGSPA